MTIYLASVRYRGAPDHENPSAFPFSVDAIRNLREIAFTRPVTFFVGENGSGKSTVLEALASATHLATAGSDSVERDPSLARQRVLGKQLDLSWERRTVSGFFLRAEDFFGFAKETAQLREAMRRESAEIDAEYRNTGRSDWARTLATGPSRRSAHEIEQRYGGDLDARSHGEGFLAFFAARFKKGGLYLIDEPEAALSPQSQLALLAHLFDMVREDGQFVIATHSPILLAFPDATIYSFDGGTIAEATYDELPGVRLTREFLAAPDRYLRRLR
ncbi:MAG TPA: AAA family ATPase [Gemmatimonadaceae bacterium]|nr:AAA family ATPase [Gemmatimonadaceae bacterium]